MVSALLCVSFGSSATLVPMEDFFGPANFRTMVISPHGKYLAATFEEDDQVKLAVLDMATKKILSKYGLGEDFQFDNVQWASDTRVIMTARKSVGNLDRKAKFLGLYATDYDGKNRKAIYSSSGNSQAFVLDPMIDDPKYALINARYIDGAKLMKVNIHNGDTKNIAGNPRPEMRGGDMAVIVPDWDLKPRFAIETNPEDDRQVVHFKGPGSDDWQVLDLKNAHPDAVIRPVGFSLDNKSVYILSNHDASTTGLFRFNVMTQEMKLVYRHPVVDINTPLIGYDRDIIGFALQPNRPAAIWVNKTHENYGHYKSLLASFPGQVVRLTSYTRDGGRTVAQVFSDKNPGEFYLFDTKTQQVTYLASVFNKIKADEMTTMEPVMITARDGVELHGYLTLPAGENPQNLPLVVNPHGGPHGPRDVWRYNPEVQFLANRGYAVLQINFRGSGGYGRDFEQSGYKRWGEEMQDDITDATHWAINEGYADANRVCIYGGSYGGYASLMAVVKEPDLYKCAVGYVGVYDLDLMKRCGDIVKSDVGQFVLAKFLGDDEERLRRTSPAKNVERIKAALFIAHGEDDVRVPMCQGKALKKALESAGKDFIWMTRDEGHGYQKLENRLAFYGTMEKFLDEHIGVGSVQSR
jgi:dipeptidyl aminopeptidase/acylaminoacyl peptidase